MLASLGEPIDSGGPLSKGRGFSDLSRGLGEERIRGIFGGREARGKPVVGEDAGR